jgi:aryl-alcohol dehydrogenase-like predicted oxidoreductase
MLHIELGDVAVDQALEPGRGAFAVRRRPLSRGRGDGTIAVEVLIMDFRERVTLGRTGLRVSRLGIGASYGVPAEAIEAAFHEYGVNYFYWGSRRRAGMGRAIRNLKGRHRDELVIALQSYDRTGLLMGLFVERALRSLGIDRAEVLILGWHSRPPAQRLVDAALALRERGRIRHLAVSGHHRPMFAELARDPGSPFDVFMIRYSAAHRGAEEEVFPHLPESGRPGITCYTATRWGQLLDPRKMPPGEEPLSAADCYRFVLSNPAVDLCMTGPANAEQMRGALRALDAGPLTPEELERVRRIGDHVRGKK